MHQLTHLVPLVKSRFKQVNYVQLVPAVMMLERWGQLLRSIWTYIHQVLQKMK